MRKHCPGFCLAAAWGILVIVILMNAAERAGEELLEAIRGRAPEFLARRGGTRGPTEMGAQHGVGSTRDPYKTFLDSLGAAAVPMPTLRLLRSLNKSGTLNEWETERREREVQAALEQERKKLDDEKDEQEARQFLIREAARVVKEREAAQKREREAEANRPRWIHWSR